MPPNPEPKAERPALDASYEVLQRFLFRTALVFFLAAFFSADFWATVTLLMFVGGFGCTWVALFRDEPIGGPSLSYWDEAAGHYGVFCFLTAAQRSIAA